MYKKTFSKNIPCYSILQQRPRWWSSPIAGPSHVDSDANTRPNKHSISDSDEQMPSELDSPGSSSDDQPLQPACGRLGRRGCPPGPRAQSKTPPRQWTRVLEAKASKRFTAPQPGPQDNYSAKMNWRHFNFSSLTNLWKRELGWQTWTTIRKELNHQINTKLNLTMSLMMRWKHGLVWWLEWGLFNEINEKGGYGTTGAPNTN